MPQNEPIKRKSRKQEFKKQIDEHSVFILTDANNSNTLINDSNNKQRYLNENLNINNNDAASSTSSSPASGILSNLKGKNTNLHGTQSQKKSLANNCKTKINNIKINAKYGNYFNDNDTSHHMVNLNTKVSINHEVVACQKVQDEATSYENDSNFNENEEDDESLEPPTSKIARLNDNEMNEDNANNSNYSDIDQELNDSENSNESFLDEETVKLLSKGKHFNMR